jgi:hypothetical protein
MVATDLTAPAGAPRGTDLPVIGGGGDASGLADMLQQFIEQTLADSPRKLQRARALRGRALFCSAEDESVRVCIDFAGDHIEVRDVLDEPTHVPTVTADFLTVAHLTSGQESPFALLARRKLTARCSAGQALFLLRMLRFLQLESAARRTEWLQRICWAALALAAACGAAWYVS